MERLDRISEKEELSAETLHAIKLAADIIADLNSVAKPHPGQMAIGRAIFGELKKIVSAECGRKFGKTEIIIYCLYRWAITHPGTFSYYVAPYSNMIGDLVWRNGRMPNYLGDAIAKKYIHSINNTEMRIMFKNGSFIKCLGSDNYDAARGYSATGIVVYDETKDHNPNFHNSFEPNLAITDAPLLLVGTPAYEEDNLFTRLSEQAKISKVGSYFNLPSHMNPHISKEYLARKEQEFRDRGEYDIFELEYLAKRVKIGSKYLFPMLKKSMVRSHDELMSYIESNRRDFDFYMAYDPGSAKCFGVILFAVHRFDRSIIVLDEIYATKLGENSTRQIVPMSIDKAFAINRNPDDWLACYDYAAAWFASEVAFEYPDYPFPLFPCEKDLKNKESKLSLIKDVMIQGLLTISDRCEKFYWEMDNYKLNDRNIVVKENDHLIDAFRYGLNLASYHTVEGGRPLDFTQKYKTGTIEQDIQRIREEDFYGDVDAGLFDN